MRTKNKTLFVLSLLCLFLNVNTLLAQVQTSVLEFWFDRNFSQRQSVPMAGQKDEQINIGALCNGIHTIEMRVQDTKGRWSAPIMKYFLKVKEPNVDNAIVKCSYWIDNDISSINTVSIGKEAALDVDITALCKGLHTLSYQVFDSNGAVGSPQMRYFIIPEVSLATNSIVAYEYWFNNGERVRVDVSPQNPFLLENTVIEIKDVMPNVIPADYTFNAAEEMVYCSDDVTFGLTTIDEQEKRSKAEVAGPFKMTVPVDPNFVNVGKEQHQFVAPQLSGQIQGLKASCEVGDIVSWTVAGSSMDFDLYNGDGSRADFSVRTLSTGEKQYEMKANSTTVYALLYNP